MAKKKPKDRNPYTTLGLSKDCTKKEIDKAWKAFARKYHPDRNPGDTEAEEKYKEGQAAYDILRDPELRRRFDETGTMRDGDAVASVEQSVVPIIMAAYTTILGDILNGDDEPASHDVIGYIRGILTDDKRKQQNKVKHLTVSKMRLEKMLGRFKTTDNRNFLEELTVREIEKVEEAIENLEREIHQLTVALNIMEEWSFDVLEEDEVDEDGFELIGRMIEGYR